MGIWLRGNKINWKLKSGEGGINLNGNLVEGKKDGLKMEIWLRRDRYKWKPG